MKKVFVQKYSFWVSLPNGERTTAYITAESFSQARDLFKAISAFYPEGWVLLAEFCCAPIYREEINVCD